MPKLEAELGMRLGRSGRAKEKPQFSSKPGPAERRCLGPLGEYSALGCVNTAPPAGQPEASGTRSRNKPLPGARASCRTHRGVQAVMLGNQDSTSETPRDPTILFVSLVFKEKLNC